MKIINIKKSQNAARRRVSSYNTKLLLTTVQKSVINKIMDQKVSGVLVPSNEKSIEELKTSPVES